MKTLDAPKCQADGEVVEQINKNVMQIHRIFEAKKHSCE